MPSDAADGGVEAGPQTLTIRVALGPLLPLTPGTGCRGLAVNARGDRTDAVAASDGILRLSANRGSGPWDLTVACQRYGAVSIVGIAGEIDETVYLSSPGEPSRPDLTTHFVSGTVTGLRSPTNRVRVEGDWLDVAGTSPSYRARFRSYPGAPPLQLIALEFDGANQLVNIVASTLTPRPARDASLDLSLPAAPSPVQSATTRVRLPATGVVASTALQLATVDVTQPSRILSERAVSVGGADVQLDAAGGSLTWTARYVRGDLMPTASTVTLTSAAAAGPNVIVRRLGLDGDAFLTIEPVRELSATGTSLADARISVQADGYDHAFASVTARGGSWLVVAHDGTSLTNRAWPSLPSGISLGDIGLAEQPLTLQVGAAKRASSSRPPWDVRFGDAEVVVIAARAMVSGEGR